MVEIIEVEEEKVGCMLLLASLDIWDSLYIKSGGIAFSCFSILQQKHTILEIVTKLEQMADENKLSSQLLTLDSCWELLLESMEMCSLLLCWFQTNWVDSQLHNLLCTTVPTSKVMEQSTILNMVNIAGPGSTNEFSQCVDHSISYDHGDQCIDGHISSLTMCLCQFSKCWGILCHHMFQMMIQLGYNSKEEWMVRSAWSWFNSNRHYLSMYLQFHSPRQCNLCP